MSQNEELAKVSAMLQTFQGLSLESKAEFLTMLTAVLPDDKGGSYLENVVFGKGQRLREATKVLTGVHWFSDVKVSDTGNLAFEAVCRRRQTFFYDSCIQHFGWRFEGAEYNGEVGLIIEAERARKIAEIQYWGRMGDDMASEGYLVPATEFLKKWSDIRRERQRRGLKD